jgi:hypothetical protein
MPLPSCLSGPRGRRLCWKLLGDSDHPGWARVRRAVLGGDLAGLTGELAACVTLADLTRISATTDEAGPNRRRARLAERTLLARSAAVRRADLRGSRTGPVGRPR